MRSGRLIFCVLYTHTHTHTHTFAVRTRFTAAKRKMKNRLNSETSLSNARIKQRAGGLTASLDWTFKPLEIRHLYVYIYTIRGFPNLSPGRLPRPGLHAGYRARISFIFFFIDYKTVGVENNLSITNKTMYFVFFLVFSFFPFAETIKKPPGTRLPRIIIRLLFYATVSPPAVCFREMLMKSR